MKDARDGLIHVKFHLSPLVLEILAQKDLLVPATFRNGLEYRWTKEQIFPLDTKISHVRGKPIRVCRPVPKPIHAECLLLHNLTEVIHTTSELGVGSASLRCSTGYS